MTTTYDRAADEQTIPTNKKQSEAVPFCTICRGRWPGAKVTQIGRNTFRVNIYERSGESFCQTNRISDTFLASVVPGEQGPVAVRLPNSPSKRIVKYSDKWKR